MQCNLDYASIIQYIEHFQTLITGVLAIFAAFLTTCGVVWAAKLPIKTQLKLKEAEDKKRAIYISYRFFEGLRFLSNHARQAHGTIKVVISSNTKVNDDIRKRTTIVFPGLIDDWESMVLLPDVIYRRSLSLMREVFDHNFDMNRAGGAFGADNFREVILRRTQSIELNAFELSNDVIRFARSLETSITLWGKVCLALNRVFSAIKNKF